ncbi:uncharacterized protein LOC134187422 [Corticium candelabrum]|uniref:uncharacterized protein LOC134187422 n=1 Tax=Corticium candelabrum TaxID=121492 RepID=UPI002E2527A9|nr:uncharacterized protein LOC134187422 [Corticium candelabrum]
MHVATVCWFTALSIISVSYGADVFLENISVTKLAFGSCNRHDLPQPLWDSIGKQEPDLFLWLGDAVYADTRIFPFVWRSSSLSVVRDKFQQQKNNPNYKKFVDSGVPIFGVWDDHDYNLNDGGYENVGRTQVQQIFLDFLDEDADSWRRSRDGLYVSYLFGKNDEKVKLVLLDVRSHFDRATGDVLGHDQWSWLEREIISDDGAALVLVASGVQVLTEMTIIDKFGSTPYSKQRLLNILSQNPKVLILSGDVHFGEISCHNTSSYPLYELTSSGLTHNCLISLVPEVVCNVALNYFLSQKKRISPYVYSGLNYGMVTINWSTRQVTMAVYGQDYVVMNHSYNMTTASSGLGRFCPTSTAEHSGTWVVTWTLGLLVTLAMCRKVLCRYGIRESRLSTKVERRTDSE